MPRPRYLTRQVAPELVAIAATLEEQLELVARRLLESAKAPERYDELSRTLTKVLGLLLVAGESGRPSVVGQLEDHETRIQRLEAGGAR